MFHFQTNNEKMAGNGIHFALASDDILTEILLRLPKKSAFKFILVSKRWLHLISSCSFHSAYQSRWGANSHLLGFFVSNIYYLSINFHNTKRAASEPALPFLSTCKEGDDLKESGMLKELGYFIDHSNDLLLCGRHPKTYYVWNTITKQKYQLPRPRQLYKNLCIAFLTEANGRDMKYRVIRADCKSRSDEVSTISIESYSSLTGTWKQSTLICTSNISFRPWTVATVIKGVIHWFASDEHLAIYDPDLGQRCITFIKQPGGEQSDDDYDNSVLGESSDGLLQYCQSCEIDLEIWVLPKEHNSYSSLRVVNAQQEYRWELRYKVSFEALLKHIPYSGTDSKLQILSSAPCDSESVFLRSGSHIYRCHLESEKMERVLYSGNGSMITWETCNVVPYVLQIWPKSLCNGSVSCR